MSAVTIAVRTRAATVGMIACALLAGSMLQARAADYFLSLQDGRAGLNDGAPIVRNAPDTLAVVELAEGHLRIARQIAVPTSLVGPPTSVAIAPGGTLALVTAATRRDPGDANRVVPYDLVSIVQLDPKGGEAPRVLSTVQTGAGASGVSINGAGTLALVANRVEGSISVLAIAGERVDVVGKVALGDKAGPSHVAFTPDGRHALVTRDGDNRVSWLDVDGQRVSVRDNLIAGIRPYGLDVSPDGAWAAITNVGGSRGDVDTISLIDLRAAPPRVVDTVSVGPTPEAVFFSPDGRSVGVSVVGGSSKPHASPFHSEARYRLFRVVDGQFRPEAEVVGGAWLQGSAFAAGGREVLVQDGLNRQIRLYRRTPDGLVDTGERLQFDGAPCAIKFWR